MLMIPMNDNLRSRIFFITTLLITGAFAQVGQFQIGDEPTSPRISSMGSAGTALGGKGFCEYNPASPAFAPAPFLSAEFGQLPGDMSKSMVETAWMFPRWFGGASMRVQSTDFGVTSEQTVGPDGVPLSSNQSLQACLTGGFTFGNGRFASGHSLDFFQERIGDKVYRAWTYSTGIVYRLLPGRMTLGASMLNYIRLDTVCKPWYTTFRDGWYRGAWGLPRYARAGGAWSDTLRQASLPFTVACDLTYSDVYDRFMVPLGAEVWITPYLAARAGIRINHPTDKFHFGTGVRWSNIAFDFDYGITQPVADATIEPKWLFGLTYSLKSTVHKYESSVAQPPLPQKKAQTAPETKTFAPPKTILLKPKQPDSSKTQPMIRDTVSKPIPEPAKAVVNPDTSVSGNLRSPAEKGAVPGGAPAPDAEKPVVPASADSAATPDFITK
jgi:hypothetical protein